MSQELHPGLHPDPDTLNAFTEGVLPEHERAGCLAHLAECARCRDVVFLAGQAAEIELPVAVAGVPFWRKVFRPAAALAVACAAITLVSFGLYRMIRSAERQPQATASAKPPVDKPPVETPPAIKADQEKPPPQREREQAPSAAVGAVAAIQPLPAPPPPNVTAPPVTAFAPGPSPPSVPPPAARGALIAAARAAEGAGVVGTVTDPAGAVIPGAQVELKSEGTGATYSSTSDAKGQFSIAGLAPGRYDFSATSTGFKKFVRPGVTVQPQEMARLDSKLDVGAATDTVTVNAEAPLLKTENGEISHQVDRTAASELPLLTSTRGYKLPDKSAPVSVAARGKLVVALDAQGALFFSDNQGKSWKHIKGKWKGKAERVVVSASAAFELTTDPASTWVSTDGRHWSAAPASVPTGLVGRIP